MLCAKSGWNQLSGSWNELLNFVHVFLLICNHLPFERGDRGPSLKKNWIPSTQECFVSDLVEISRLVLEEKMKMWKVYKQS